MAQHKLVIAEKPSVAQNLAAVIGATVRKDGYLEGNGWRVSWCVGHLAGLADADSYDPKYAKCDMMICLSCRNIGRWWWEKIRKSSLIFSKS